jgi:hypothetical protein
MFQSAGRSLRDGLGQPCGAAFGDHDGAGSRSVSGANDGAQVVRIFDSVQHDQKFGSGGDVFELRVFLFGTESDDTLMGLGAGETVQRASVFETHGRFVGSGEVDDFLEAMAPGATRDDDAFERAFCAQSFGDGMNTNQDGQLSIIPRADYSR